MLMIFMSIVMLMISVINLNIILMILIIMGYESGNLAELKTVRILMILIITSIMIIIKTDQVRWEQ